MVHAAAGLREGAPGGGGVCAAYHIGVTGLRIRALLAGLRRALPRRDAPPSTFLCPRTAHAAAGRRIRDPATRACNATPSTFACPRRTHAAAARRIRDIAVRAGRG